MSAGLAEPAYLAAGGDLVDWGTRMLVGAGPNTRYEVLTLAELAVLLIARSLGDGFLLLQEQAPKWPPLEQFGENLHHNLGDIAVSNGDPLQAVLQYRKALTGFRRVHDRRDVALALCSLGRALVVGGQRREGLAMLRESELLAIELGDESRLSETRNALVEAALPPDARSLPDGLTARQAEILGLVAAGLSNRDVAARLNLAAGTVERHLANIYRKIDVSGHVAAARYALDHGLGAVAP